MADLMSSTGEKPLKIVLDGPSYAGKSVLYLRLSTGTFKIATLTIGTDFTLQCFNVNGMEFKTLIFDTNYFNYKYKYSSSLYNDTDVILEVFAINEPSQLQEVLNERIPFFQESFPNTPIVLVGTQSDLRQDNTHQSPLFPVACGQVLAHLAGAVNYVECSAKLGLGVHEVFREAICATFGTGCFGITNDDLKRLLITKIPMGDEWMSIMNGVNLKITCPTIDPILRNQLEHLDKHLFNVASNLEFSLENICFCRTQEVETIHLASGLFDVEDITLKYFKANCTWWCIDELKHHTSDDIKGLTKDVADRKSIVSLRFVKHECSAISEFILSCAPIAVRSLVIISCIGTLSFNFLSALLEGLQYLVIVNTKVDFTTLQFPLNVVDSLEYLVLKKCDTQPAEVPPAIGKMGNLQVLDITCNHFTKLPKTIGHLHKLRTLLFDQHKMVFPPSTVVHKSAKDIVQYLKAIQEWPVKNREAKLIVAGQEGVGKSTFIKSLKSSPLSRWLWDTTPPPKTDGVEISVLHLKGDDCKVYDLAGDVEYLNTHSLFFSRNSLHLAVFNLSQLAVSKEIRPTDQFCRLELWLQTIACQDVHSYAIIVGTHADHPMLSSEVLGGIRTSLSGILAKYRSQHLEPCEECWICNPEKSSNGLAVAFDNSPGTNNSTSSCVPHILGYCEVSGIKNININNLMQKVTSSIADLKKYTSTEEIPKIWLLVRTSIMTKLSQDEELKKQPLLSLSCVHDLAYEAEGIAGHQSIIAMLRFFHSQGDFLWYEDIPEMKDIVIVDPQWLSNQLRTLISHRSSVDAICEGVLHHSELPEFWVNMDEENCSKLLSLFRSVGLCFSISGKEELFPCNLPVGWPDRKMWPPLPDPNENQTSFLFLFSFVPPSFFPDVIVAINKKRDTFVSNVQPLYYRFNAVYITKEHCMCDFHNEEEYVMETSVGSNGQQVPSFHRIHLELMPYNNSLKVTIRGANPCCMVPNIRSLVKDVKSRCYPGITYKERLVCPKCEMEKVDNPSSFGFGDSHDGFCPKGHNVGSSRDILAGKLSSSSVVPLAVGQTGRTMGEVLEDHFCPKLFAVLPINLEGLSLKDRFVYSYIRDGYAVHLLCECPGEWHFVASPGFRVGKPKGLFEKYGKRVCKVLRVISALGAPFQIASAVEPHCKVGAAAASAAENVRKDLQVLLENYLDKYPHLRGSLGSPNDDLDDLKSSDGLQRSELCRLLEIKAAGRDFGPLACTYVDKLDEWLWLCEEHNQKYKIVKPRTDK